MNPANCKMIKPDVKLSYTRVTTEITCQLGLFPEGAEVAALGHSPNKQTRGRILELNSGHAERKNIPVIPGRAWIPQYLPCFSIKKIL